MGGGAVVVVFKTKARTFLYLRDFSLLTSTRMNKVERG